MSYTYPQVSPIPPARTDNRAYVAYAQAYRDIAAGAHANDFAPSPWLSTFYDIDMLPVAQH
jgi:hypothetical protein